MSGAGPAFARWGLFALLALGAIGCRGTAERPAEREVPVRVGSVALDRFNSPVVILEESEGTRTLPIWIGPAEAGSIAAQLQKQPTPRPNFHDFATRLIESLQAQVARVVVTELRENTYYAIFVLRVNGRLIEIDVRPSDAIAVALRLDAPILVRESLFERPEEPSLGGDSGQAISLEAPSLPQPVGRPPATPAREI